MSEDASSTGDVTVATWNLWWRFGDWEARIAVITEVLAQLRPDVVGLQEVWATADQNAAGLLADALGMNWTWAPSPHPEHWRQRLPAGHDLLGIGNAIVSRWPILEPMTVALPFGDRGDFGRTVLTATIDAPGGSLPFFTTQLDSHPADSAVRVKQVTTVARLVHDRGQHTAYPPVVTGDFNAVAESDEMRLLEGHLTEPVVPGQVLVNVWRYAPADETGVTWDAANPNVAATGEPPARIDHIMVGLPTGPGTGRVLDVSRFGTEAVRGVWPSDHAAVTARLAAASTCPDDDAEHQSHG